MSKRWLILLAILCAHGQQAFGKNADSCVSSPTGVVAVESAQGVLLSWQVATCTASPVVIYRNGKRLKVDSASGSWLDKGASARDNYTFGPDHRPIRMLANGYLDVPIELPGGRKTPTGEVYNYTANDGAVADLDGDGEPEIVLKWVPDIAKDNAFGGYTGETLIDAYELDGTKLWRIDLGRNIRSGAHYTQMVVADLDGDGKAEVMLKTADGTIDGKNAIIGDGNADWRHSQGSIPQQDRTGSVPLPNGTMAQNLEGRILAGPEFLTVFEGTSGRAISTVPYIPARIAAGTDYDPELLKATWGDAYGNRSERYLAGAAWFDGKLPSAIFARGYYGRTVVTAWDFRNGKLTNRWVFDTTKQNNSAAAGQGNHQFSVADLDADGRDEIVYGAMALDDDGTLLWNSGLRHGDTLHVGELDPSNPGLERFGVHEEVKANGGIGAAMLDGATGRVLWTTHADRDTGRGLCADIDPEHAGDECWSSNESVLRSAQGGDLGKRRPKAANFAIYWDDDAQRELLDGTRISKWLAKRAEEVTILDPAEVCSNNGTKANPVFSGDILGDWREELIVRTCDNRSLRIYVSPIPSKLALRPLDSDRTYRAGLIGQNSGYNQPAHLGTELPKLSVTQHNRQPH